MIREQASSVAVSGPEHVTRTFIKVFLGGLGLGIWLVVIAGVVIEFVPHVRGLGYPLQLRYSILMPSCWVVSTAAAISYLAFCSRFDRPRRAHTISLVLLATLCVALTYAFGPRQILLPVVAITLCGAGYLAWRTHDAIGKRKPIIAVVFLFTFGLLELVGEIKALEVDFQRGPSMATLTPLKETQSNWSKFTELHSGARIHYVDVGKGPILLFLHGNPASSYQWRSLIQGLRGSFRCIALDYPGFGLSQAPVGYGFTPREQSRLVEEFVDQLSLSGITLVMQDWGGPIGVGFAERRPELVQSLVLGNTWFWPTTAKEIRGRFSTIAGGPIGEFVQMNFNYFPRMAIDSGINRRLSDDAIDAYVKPFQPLDRRGIAVFYPKQILDANDYLSDLQSHLDRINKKKTLIFWGLKDPGFPRVDMEQVESRLPNHLTMEFGKAGHFFFEDTSQEIVAQILQQSEK